MGVLVQVLVVAALMWSAMQTAAAQVQVPSNRNITREAMELVDDNRYEVFGYEITLPQFFVDAKNWLGKMYDKGKTFLSGKTEYKTSLFGKPVTLKAHMPTSSKDFMKSVRKFFSRIATDATTRIIFIIYVNVVIGILVYTLLFVQHVRISLGQKREANRKKREDNLHTSFVRSPDLEIPRNNIRQRRMEEAENNDGDADDTMSIHSSAANPPSTYTKTIDSEFPNVEQFDNRNTGPRFLDELAEVFSPLVPTSRAGDLSPQASFSHGNDNENVYTTALDETQMDDSTENSAFFSQRSK